ncbi:polyisoprenoid-binding protein YceI [Variovorax boronicumulans]|uniref:Polyisoprenoid-binding protein YceI n=1 Tax=Variovorax boronicumulans TaxID=436515 RepID=A0AAW8CXA9_9BURK|nr:YceI family protein [Variovorax boronicumulans]MDP9893826.1 polyisoprenoid-binding protein YceI [Variovorax boronicumulans]MDQ0053643.1 polyisoprenoid-binding protein YceI [Variovorax boronicumulans]
MKQLAMRLALFALACVAGGANAQLQQQLIAAGSEIIFTNKQMGVSMSGRFKRFDAAVSFEPSRPQTSKIGLVVDLTSVALGSADNEALLARTDWFDSKNHPKASFESTSVKALDAKKFEARGKLTLKGVSRDVVVPFDLSAQTGDAVVTGAFMLRRKDFGIGIGEWEDVSLVANEVNVRFRFVLRGLPPPR